MRDVELEDILDTCLAKIRSGQATVDECLWQHADRAPVLESLLHQAVRLTTLPSVTMPADAVDVLEKRVLSRAAEIRAGLVRKEKHTRQPFSPRLGGRRARLLPVVLSLMITLAVASTWAVSASASSLPGKALYPVKLAAEKVRLVITFRREARAWLHLAFAERRLEEIQTLSQEAQAVQEGLLDALVAETRLVLEEIQDVGSDRKAEVAAKLLVLTERQQVVLASVRERGPKEAQRGLNRALEASQQGHKQALMALGVTSEPSATPSASLTHTLHAAPKLTRTSHATPTRKLTHTPHAAPTHKPTQPPTPRAMATRTLTPAHMSPATPTRKPEPTEPPEPVETPEPTGMSAPTKAFKPTKRPKPSKTPRPTKTPKPTKSKDR